MHITYMWGLLRLAPMNCKGKHISKSIKVLNECYKVNVVTMSKSKPVHVRSTKHMFVISCNKGYQTRRQLFQSTLV